ncbi:MAG TPA: ribonuclease H [Acidimicrobiia bacterium]|nr:ribonuclease H [Acidimicrobiia bacterium]
MTFTCRRCDREFEVRQDVLDRYPGWTPQECLDCRDNAGRPVSSGERSAGSAKRPSSQTSRTKGKDLTIAEVLASFGDGPDSGVFTDGASEGNPGPGGWGAVYVQDGEVVDEARGSEPHTTNNKMELTALIAGLRMVPLDAEVDIYTDSQLIVNIITKWADGWKARGWTKKSSGPIANLDLVKEAHALYKQRPGARLQWIKAHSGNRWNEYADALATSYRREIH